MFYLLILLNILLDHINDCSEFVPCPEPWQATVAGGERMTIENVERCENICGKSWAVVTSYENKSFICFQRMEKAFPLTKGNQEDTGSTCECAHRYYNKVKKEYDFKRCEPPKQFSNVPAQSNICTMKCKELKILIYSPYGSNNIIIQDCGDLLTPKSKFFPKPLRGQPARVYRTGRFPKTGCMCGLSRSDLKESIEYESHRNEIHSKSRIQNKIEFTPCPEPWKATVIRMKTFFTKEETCTLKCTNFFGIFLSNEKIICYHRVQPAVPIPNEDNTCECGVKFTTYNGGKKIFDYEGCKPPKKFDDILNRKLCKKECNKINLLLHRPPKCETMIRDCGNLITDKKSDLSKPQKLDGIVSYRFRSNDNAKVAQCQCGLNYNATLKYKNINFNISVTNYWMDQVPRKKRTPKIYAKNNVKIENLD